MKGKAVMAVTLGIICILLSSVMFLQFKSVQVIEESGVGAMRESELKTEYTSLKEKSDELKTSLEETQKSIDEYESQSTDTQGTLDLLKSDIAKANTDLGYTNVKGPGLEITISDGNGKTEFSSGAVTYSDLLFAINELKYAGAEAISVNDERVVNNTFIKSIQDKFIVVNGVKRIISPYTIKVIGDVKYLESVINIKGGLKDELTKEGKNITYTVKDEVDIGKYENLIEINYGE